VRIDHPGLFTDLYELTMAQGYLQAGCAGTRAGFDYFFKTNPFGGGYVLFAGLEDLLDRLEGLRFADDDLEYLASLGFNQDFLARLRSFAFGGDVWSASEGEVVFPNEPLLRVEAELLEAQLVETLVLNILNFESLIATKASRIRQVVKDRVFTDFGLRRAHGLGGIHASRAAIIGGADSTSNVWAARAFGLEATGTQAHSWIQVFEDELEAFRRHAEQSPDRCVLLVDTYDTLASGVPNAIRVGRELEGRGHRLQGIRLDSGDLAYLSRQARRMLDEAGLPYVQIVASNQLDEYVIRSLNEQQAPIDVFGVGTRLVTAQGDPALDGVYKLSMFDGGPRMKISDDLEKSSLPGVKQVHRFLEDGGAFHADGVGLAGEGPPAVIHHPYAVDRRLATGGLKSAPLLTRVMERGRRTRPPRSVREIRAVAAGRLERLPPEYRRFENPHLYKVGLSDALMRLRRELGDRLRRPAGGPAS